TFQVKYTAAIPIESLIGLPDGMLLGSARQYHGFFKFDPGAKKTQPLGQLDLSGGPRARWHDHIYLSGYPNAPLYEYDATRAWIANQNPTLLGRFLASGTHYAYFLESSGARLYYVGRRERDGVGSGIGFFDGDTRQFAGHHDGLSALD